VGDSPHRNATSAATELGRRQFMRKAAVAGAIVWTVPTIVSIEPAGAADRHSRPPKPPVDPVGGVVSTPHGDGDGDGQKDAAQLPFTGDNEILELGVGVAAITAGAAMLMLSAESADAAGATEAFRAEQ
jgi:hypothetical protein